MAIRYIDLVNGNDANNGLSWANAKLSYASMASSVVAGDEIRFAKSPDPVLICDALWTNLSKEVVLSVAQTKTITNCNEPWIKATEGKISTATAVTNYRKIGTHCCQLYFGSTTGITSNTRQAYFTLPAQLDLSAYQQLSLQLYPGGAIPQDSLKIVLCSDSNGLVPVDEFIFPTFLSSSYNSNVLQGYVFSRSGGGNLGSAINSIALYTHTSPTTALNYKYVRLDNIIASKTGGLNHNYLISKNGNPLGGDEGSYVIQSIDEAVICIDNSPVTTADQGQGYVGATETVATFYRETIPCISTMTFGVRGTEGNLVSYKGGYDIISNEQTGITCLSGLNGRIDGIIMSVSKYVSIEGFSLYNFKVAFTMSSAGSDGNYTYLSFQDLNNNLSRGLLIKARLVTIVDIKCINNNGNTTNDWGVEYSGMYYAGDIANIKTVNSNANGVQATQTRINMYGFSIQNSLFIGIYASVSYSSNYGIKWSEIYNINLDNSKSTCLHLVDCDGIYVHDLFVNKVSNLVILLIIDRCNQSVFKNIVGDHSTINTIYLKNSTDFFFENVGSNTNFVTWKFSNAFGTISVRNNDVFGSDYSDNNSEVGILNYITGEQKFYNTPYSFTYWQTIIYPPGAAGSIRIQASQSAPTIFKRFRIAEIAFEANATVTITLQYMMPNSISSIEMTVFSNLFYGLLEDVKALLSFELNVWRTASLSFTPTRKGVLPLCLDTKSFRGDLYIGEITINQN